MTYRQLSKLFPNLSYFFKALKLNWTFYMKTLIDRQVRSRKHIMMANKALKILIKRRQLYLKAIEIKKLPNLD